MGLLDQILGQVIGGMAGGGSGSPQPGFPTGQQGGPPPGGGGGGGLGDLLAGVGGKYSPLVMALLSLLASKHMGGGGGGGSGGILGDILGRMTGGASSRDERGPSGRDDRADDGEDDRRGGGYGRDGGYGQEDEEEPPRGRGGRSDEGRGGGLGGGREDGGFLNTIGSMLDGPGGASSQRGATGGSETGQGGGFEDLFERFRRNGKGDLMESWVGGGPNQAASPQDLNQAIGPDVVDDLSRKTGLGRDDLLSQLAQALPQVVDKLTPHGRVPDEREQRGWL